MFDLKQIIEGNLYDKDIVFGTLLLLLVGYCLITINTLSPTPFTNLYLPLFLLVFIIWVLSILAKKNPNLKILPIASIGFGNMDKDFWRNVGIGLAFGFILVMGLFNVTGSFLEVSVPNLGISDPAQNVFLSAFVVPIIEEGTTAMTILPSVANLLAQGGTMVLFLMGGALSFFFFSGYNLLSLFVLVGLGIYFRKAKVENMMLIIVIAILVDGIFFTVLHLNVYPLTSSADKLVKVFLYRVIGDTLVVATGSICPVLIAHSINNAITVSYVKGVWVVSPVIALGTVALMILVFWGISKIEKIKAI